MIARRFAAGRIRKLSASPVEPPEIPPATPGTPSEPPPGIPPGNPRPEIPPPVREPGEPPRPDELPGKTPDELAGSPSATDRLAARRSVRATRFRDGYSCI
jgi:hypothetical protein